jgi:predicted transcriptional regulator|tara:strand:- start:27892 stop:28602 length:711 start_codon:yes stop_codon:yes gene_type:complete
MAGWLSWIRVSDENQVRWAVNYLFRKSLIYPGMHTSDLAWTFTATVQSWPKKGTVGEEKFELLDKKMRAAWGQHKRRKKPSGSKSYSFTMKKEVGSALAALAKKADKTISQVLEEMVLEDRAQSKILEERHKKELAAIKADLADVRKVGSGHCREAIEEVVSTAYRCAEEPRLDLPGVDQDIAASWAEMERRGSANLSVSLAIADPLEVAHDSTGQSDKMASDSERGFVEGDAGSD